MRKLIAAALAAFFLSSPAIASECIPIARFDAEIAQMNMPNVSVYRTDDLSFVNAYTKALGFSLPDNSAPVGMMVVTHQNRALVMLVENEGGKCIRYSATIPLQAHQAAFAAATSGV